jgi:hypothetical protein
VTQVFAYYYPGFHPAPEVFTQFPENWTEWELMRNARPFFEGHYQPRVPLWGYEDETRADVMRRKLETAREYAVDSLLFISYWYFGRSVFGEPLRVALDAATADGCARPSMMWGNHNRYLACPEPADESPRIHLHVDYSWDNCRRMVGYWIDHYFSHPGYFKLPDGRLFFSLYSPQSILQANEPPSFLKRFIIYLREGLRRNGLPEVHVHACETRFVKDLEILKLGFDSCSDYLALGYSENVAGKEPHLPLQTLRGALVVETPFRERVESIVSVYKQLSGVVPVNYYPVVTVGRDCSPRVDRLSEVRSGHYSPRPIVKEFGPSEFERLCLAAREFLNAKGYECPLLFVNAWNEWTEGAYVEPDTRYKYSLLDVIRRVFSDSAAPKR